MIITIPLPPNHQHLLPPLLRRIPLIQHHHLLPYLRALHVIHTDLLPKHLVRLAPPEISRALQPGEILLFRQDFHTEFSELSCHIHAQRGQGRALLPQSGVSERLSGLDHQGFL